jgi:hypothetical protein
MPCVFLFWALAVLLEDMSSLSAVARYVAAHTMVTHTMAAVWFSLFACALLVLPEGKLFLHCGGQVGCDRL